ncbi:MAG: ankyrin repeat domain-containing protein [Acidobacteria bacterium]|nr:MAG: ankyrin repeat domain-containing protein [Acidobacteriota bacterium]
MTSVSISGERSIQPAGAAFVVVRKVPSSNCVAALVLSVPGLAVIANVGWWMLAASGPEASRFLRTFVSMCRNSLAQREGANVNAVTELGVTPFWLAAQNGNASMVELLLEAGADPDAALPSGETLGMSAARSGDPAVVRQLLTAGADPDRKATRGQTALMWAAGQGHSGVIEALLEFGADPHSRSDIRKQFMKTDKAQQSDPSYQVWVEKGGNTALMFAARSGDLRSVELLVHAGADVNAVAAFGISPTIMAVHGGNAESVEFLLQSGAKPNSAVAGHTALHVAVMLGNDAATRVLLAYDADPNARVERATPTRRQSLDFHFHETFVGATPLWLAARYTEPGAMAMLLEYGADARFVHEVSYPERSNAGRKLESHRLEEEGGISVLMAAMGMGNRRLRRGSGPDRRGDLASLPANQLNPDVRESLALDAARIAVAAGVDINLQNASNQSALDAARNLGYDSVVKFLLESEARVSF